MIEETLKATQVPSDMTKTALSGDEILISSDQLGHGGQPPLSDPRDVRLDYLVAEFRGPSCGQEPFQVQSRYTGVVQTVDKEFNRTQIVVPAPAGESSRILSPVFYEYGPYWFRFDGFVLPRERAECLATMLHAEHPGDLPFPFLFASLGPNWRTLGLYQRFTWE